MSEIDIDEIRATPEQIAAWQAEQAAKAETKPNKPKRSKFDKLEFCILPKRALKQVIANGYMPALTVLLALYEICYLDSKHRNPVTLTSESLEAYQVSRKQKYLALKALAEHGVISVEQIQGKNPLVTLNFPLPFN